MERTKVVVEVERRADTGKNACRRMRAAGRVPGNVYGLALQPFMVSVSPRRIEEVLQSESGHNTVFTLSLEGTSSRAAMIRELQRDPVNERLLHVDFIRVDLKKKIQVSVPVRLVGTPAGVKNEGGVLDFVHREVEVECLPDAIPEHYDVDVSELHINQHVSVSGLAAIAGVEILDEPDQIIAVVSPPRIEEEPTPTEEVAEAAGEAAAEPEVIKKGKEAEEPGAEADKGKDKAKGKEK